MGDNFLVSGLIVKYVSVNYIKTFQFKMFYHVISTVKKLYRSTPDDDPCLGLIWWGTEIQEILPGFPDKSFPW